MKPKIEIIENDIIKVTNLDDNSYSLFRFNSYSGEFDAGTSFVQLTTEYAVTMFLRHTTISGFVPPDILKIERLNP